MWDWIEKNRKKSRSERSRLTFILSISLTGVIVLVWSTVILPRTLSFGSQNSSKADSATPFRVLSENLGIIMDDAQRGLEGVQNIFQGDGVENADTEGSVVEDSAGTESAFPESSRGEIEVDVLDSETINPDSLEEESVKELDQSEEVTETSGSENAF